MNNEDFRKSIKVEGITINKGKNGNSEDNFKLEDKDFYKLLYGDEDKKISDR